MASEILSYPWGTDAFRPESISFQVMDSVLFSDPPLGGGIKTFEIPGDWLVATITYAIQTREERRTLAGWWAKAGLRRNRVLIANYAQPAPSGSMRGSPLVKTAIAAGAASVVLKTMNGTLKMGDWIGLSDGPHIVTGDVNPVANEGTVGIIPQARSAVAADSAAVWDMPTGRFVCLTPPQVPFSGSGAQPGFSVSLVEAL